MAKNPVFRDLKPVGGTKKHAFDKSRRDIFSIKPAMLTPCFVEDTIPNSEYRVRNANIIRVDAIQSTPFARVSSNVEYHFVPYSQIFRDFERVYYERGDIQRNALNVENPVSVSKVPNFAYGNVSSKLFEQWIFLRVFYALQEFKSLYLDTVFGDENTNEHPLSTTIRVFAYGEERTGTGYPMQILYEDYLFINEFLDRFRISTLVTADGFPLRDVHGRMCVEDCMRNFDLLGYGNLLPVFKSIFDKLDVVGFKLTDEGTLYYSFVNYVGIQLIPVFQNTSDYLQIISDISTQVSRIALYPFNGSEGALTHLRRAYNQKVSIFRIAAYEKVWSDYYRNSQYDVNTNYAYFFNYDWWRDSDLISEDKVIECLKPKYRQWKKDVFTGGYPSAQFGSVAVASLENPSTIVANLDNDLPSATPVRANTDGTLMVGNSVTDSFNLNSSVSALSIRQAMAMQRYKERVLRAGNRIHNLQKALFGDSSRYIEDEYCQFINAFHSPIDFNSVAATAEGNERNVGELSSYGVSTYVGDAFKFHSHDFGVLIGLQYLLPESEYEAYGLDPQVTKSVSSDFYKEDFQNLGLAPVFNYNINYLQRFENVVTGALSTDWNGFSVLNYLARYWEYKLSYDKVHGEFFNSTPFTPIPFATGMDKISFTPAVGAFANFVTPRVNSRVMINTLSQFYCDPNCIDSIFYVGSDETQASDHFKVNMSHEVTCILPMSVVGLPSL